MTQSNTRPVSSGRYSCIAPRYAGISKAIASNTKRNENKLPARMSVFLYLRKGIFTSGLGDIQRRMVVAISRNTPVRRSATIVPEYSQLSRSPWSRAAKIKLKPRLPYRKPTQLIAGLGPVRAGCGGIAR